MAKNRLETDTETLEWINSFLVKFWPIYAPVMSDTIINSVDQVLSTAKPAFLDNLRMKTFVLGSKPPRLDHVKTYPKTEVDIVLMDWKFSFTPNDTMDLTARQLLNKTNPKVVLEVRMGKGVVSKGLDVIVEDFAFSGLMRVKVKLQVPFPHIERVDICFLGEPEIDYVCKPLGGEYLGFDINFIPGLETFIKDQIHGNLAPMMYEPNVFPIEIAKMLAGNPVDQAIGVVAVTLHGAHNLKNTDKFSGSPDPYVLVSVNSRAALGRTKTAHDTSNPRWNETIYVVITSFMDSLTMQVRDHNEFLNHKELGVASFPMESLEQDAEHENLTLDVLASGRPRGVLNCDIRFFPVLTGKMTETGADEPPPEMNTGIARFTVELAKDLDASKSIIGQLNPYAVLLLNGKEIHVTKKLKRTNNPIFPDPSKEVLITDRKTARFGVMIKDDRDLSTDPIIGKYQIKLTDLMRMMDKGQEWFHLQGAKTGRVKLKVDWKPVALKGIVGTAGYVNPIGVLRIHIMNARDLRNVETMGKSDPYVRLLLSGIEKRRTVTWNNNLNPDWNEIFYIPVHSAREKIALEVMDEENLGKDRSLGLVELAAADYIKESSDGQYEVDDEKALMTTPLRLEGRGTAKGTLSYTVAFYPTLNVADPEEEEEDAKAERAMEGRSSLESARQSLDAARKLPGDIPGASAINGRPSVDTALSKQLTNGTDGMPGSPTSAPEKAVPSIRLTPQNIHQYGEYL
jgi:Ca2+-dependent lipid-binding protein